MLHYAAYIALVFIALLIPGLALVQAFRPNWSNEAKFAFAYAPTLILYAILGAVFYVTSLPRWIFSLLLIGLLISSGFYLWRNKTGLKIPGPQMAVWALALSSLIFISLPISSSQKDYIPDPQPVNGRAYDSFNVKILNLSHTQANDNYIPYRQAQLLANRLDIGTTPFIAEWGVNFFFRTPFMGFVTAFFFVALNESVPEALLWTLPEALQGNTYQHFQILSHLMNALLLLPGYLIIKRMFGERPAQAALCLAVISPFFMYNEFFSWPKSLVAYFIMLSWFVLLKNGSPIVAGALMGVAYLTHDLAALYLVGTLIYLVLKKKWRALLLMLLSAGLIASVWYIISKIGYNQSSLFLYYPFSLRDIPSDPSKVIPEFLSTPLHTILGIKIDSLSYLLLPYPLYHTNGQPFIQQLWATTIFSIPGSIGLALYPFTLMALWNWRNKWRHEYIAFLLMPILACVFVIGWPRGLGSMHFAEPIVLLGIGLGVARLINLPKVWTVTVLAGAAIQTALINLYAYNFDVSLWFSNAKSVILFIALISIIGWYAISFYRIMTSSRTKSAD